jgi:DNA-binding LytR/AlgR family response regulator
MTMNELEKDLPEGRFLRIHRSYIVSFAKITAYNQHDVEVGKEELPIGRSYRDEVLKILEKGSK